ncbi:hypothetical protein BH24PSE2_BH24PSE2_13870 [soil metagenome]
MRRWVGRWIIGVGIIHAAFGFVIFREPLLAILRDGVWNAVDGHPGRPLAFWFVFLGLFTIVFGSLVDSMESRGLSLPRFLSWAFFVLVVLGIVTMPVGGGWLLLPAGLGVVVRSYRRETSAGAAV